MSKRKGSRQPRRAPAMIVTAMGGASFSCGAFSAAYDIKNVQYAAMAYAIGMISMLVLALIIAISGS